MAGSRFSFFSKKRNSTDSTVVAPGSNEVNAEKESSYEFNAGLGSLHMGFINANSRGVSPYSTEEISIMAQDPMNHITQLRQWAKWAYYSNGVVTTAIDSLKSLHSLDYIVVAKPKKAGAKRAGYRNSADKMNSVLRSMRYKEVIRDAIFHDANDGMYVGYMETRTVPVDHKSLLTDYDISNITEVNSAGVNTVVISLPIEYVRIIGRRNNCYEVAFNLRYFDTMSENERKRKLLGFPKQIQDGWDKYHNGESLNGANKSPGRVFSWVNRRASGAPVVRPS